ncbi:MAG TPA: adenylate/guanylate cyclase domain-containing protein [Gaiellaceae bacterium]
MDQPETHYARSGDVSIAYQAFGTGPIDLVFAPGYVSNIELGWSLPDRREFLEALAEFTRVIQFDKRGTGLSDPVLGHASLETRMEDLRTVMDAVRSTRAVLLGVDNGGMMSIVFAATYPDRTAGLLLTGTAARTLWAPEHPWGPTEEEYVRSIGDEERRWGTTAHAEDSMERVWPSLSRTSAPEWAAYLRHSASPGAYATYRRMNMENDVRAVLAAIHLPTLVAHRTGDRVVDLEAARYLAERIPNARFLELPGDDHSPFARGGADLVDVARAFVADVTVTDPEEPERVLATILFTDIVGSTAKAAELGDREWRKVLEEHNRVIRRELGRHGGKEIDTAGDGFFASFEGPARAIRFAQAAQAAVADLGFELRAGLHTGECELIEGKVGGIAVHIGARIAAAAFAGEVLVSSTVKELVAGSGIEFDDRGEMELKGIPGVWRLYAVRA